VEARPPPAYPRGCVEARPTPVYPRGCVEARPTPVYPRGCVKARPTPVYPRDCVGSRLTPAYPGGCVEAKPTLAYPRGCAEAKPTPATKSNTINIWNLSTSALATSSWPGELQRTSCRTLTWSSSRKMLWLATADEGQPCSTEAVYYPVILLLPVNPVRLQLYVL